MDSDLRADYRIDVERASGSREFLLPERLILTELATLSGDAVKLYLILSYCAECQSTVPTIDEISSLAGFGQTAYHKALNELMSRHLLRLEKQRYLLADLRQFNRLQQQFLEAPESSESASCETGAEEREETIQQINEIFFQGTMSPTIYRDIERWFVKYQFSPHVIYALFSEAERNGARNAMNYIRAIADNWHQLGIRSHEELDRYFDEREAMREEYEIVRQRMNFRAPLTTYQKELVRKWCDDWGFSLALIDRAMRETNKISSPNLAYVDAVLKTWHEVGIKNEAELEDYLAKLPQNSSQKKGSRRAVRERRENRGNFAGRQEEIGQVDSLKWLMGQRSTETELEGERDE